jgi:general stress protein 26
MNEAVIDGAPVVDTDARTEQQRKDLYTRIKKTPTCLLLTHDAVGGMHVRPMTTQQVEEPGILWMFMSARGRLAEEIAANPEVLVTYGHPSDGAYAAVRGRAMAVHDIEKARELWTAALALAGRIEPRVAARTMSWAEAGADARKGAAAEIAAAALTRALRGRRNVPADRFQARRCPHRYNPRNRRPP